MISCSWYTHKERRWGGRISTFNNQNNRSEARRKDVHKTKKSQHAECIKTLCVWHEKYVEFYCKINFSCEVFIFVCFRERSHKMANPLISLKFPCQVSMWPTFNSVTSRTSAQAQAGKVSYRRYKSSQVRTSCSSGLRSLLQNGALRFCSFSSCGEVAMLVLYFLPPPSAPTERG